MTPQEKLSLAEKIVRIARDPTGIGIIADTLGGVETLFYRCTTDRYGPQCAILTAMVLVNAALATQKVDDLQLILDSVARLSDRNSSEGR